MGVLYIMATPIGNLKDITLRAIETFRSVDYILCEDTRVTGRLLKQYEISKKLVSFNDFSEDSKTPKVIQDLFNGFSIALVSDAGTPLISDPGYKLVRDAIHQGIRVESISGLSSVITALVVSGLPPDKFLFLGYVPQKSGKRLSFFKSLFIILQSMEDKNMKPTVILFESPHRLITTLANIKDIFGDVAIVICRELTKLHEEIRRERIAKSIEHFSETKPKGEFVILF